MKFNEILNICSHGSKIRSVYWECSGIFDYVLVLWGELNNFELLIKHKDGHWQAIFDKKYFEKIDGWEFLS